MRVKELVWVVVALSTSALANASNTITNPDSVFPVPLCNGICIEDATISTLQRLLTLGFLTSEALTACYLERIAATNDHLHSISETNPDALSIARALDSVRANGTTLGPLHGIPFLVKDNYFTNDKHNTSEGGLVLLGGRYPREATVVQRLRAAGAVLIGHASLSEAADHRATTNYSEGYSTRASQIRNPFNLTQPTRGSSGGSAVAVRTNQIAFALGTETHGSLTHPAGDLGLYTLKSTPGLMSRHGIIPGSFYHDTPGPLARSMSDVAAVLDVMAGPHPRDNLTWQGTIAMPHGGFSSQLATKDALRGMKLGIPWDPYWSTISHINSPGVRALYEKRISELRAAGAEIYNVSMPGIASIANPYGSANPSDIDPAFKQQQVYNALLAVAYAEWLEDWTFSENDTRHGMSSLKEMAEWNTAQNATTGALGSGYWWYNTESGQDFYDQAVATNGSLGEAFWAAFGWGRSTAQTAVEGGLVSMADDGEVVRLDGLLVPNGDAGGQGDACASIPSYGGTPVATVPFGLTGYNVPCGLCIYGRKWGEAELVRVASAMEDLWRWNERPTWENWQTAHGRLEGRISFM
ncbi:amidase signature enzyme [Teratosphaeria nubilosa]|uniref:Amidase signature enzyme n=1 Tax=Teratosphaeria nubilosa TaxID=161662 RepID=A0A6G1LBA3_9PEZI|nr:amidase signature enzyme [Teratosphaeria nubilosa]